MRAGSADSGMCDNDAAGSLDTQMQSLVVQRGSEVNSQNFAGVIASSPLAMCCCTFAAQLTKRQGGGLATVPLEVNCEAQCSRQLS